MIAALTQRVGSIYPTETVLAADGPAWNHSGLAGFGRSIAVFTAVIRQQALGELL